MVNRKSHISFHNHVLVQPEATRKHCLDITYAESGTIAENHVLYQWRPKTLSGYVVGMGNYSIIVIIVIILLAIIDIVYFSLTSDN